MPTFRQTSFLLLYNKSKWCPKIFCHVGRKPHLDPSLHSTRIQAARVLIYGTQIEHFSFQLKKDNSPEFVIKSVEKTISKKETFKDLQIEGIPVTWIHRMTRVGKNLPLVHFQTVFGLFSIPVHTRTIVWSVSSISQISNTKFISLSTIQFADAFIFRLMATINFSQTSTDKPARADKSVSLNGLYSEFHNS